MQDYDVLPILLDNQFYKTEQVTGLLIVEDDVALVPQPHDALRRLAALFAYGTQTGWTIDWRFLQTHFALSNKESNHLRDLHRVGQASVWWTDRLMAAVATFDRAIVLDLCVLSVVFGHGKYA